MKHPEEMTQNELISALNFSRQVVVESKQKIKELEEEIRRLRGEPEPEEKPFDFRRFVH